MQLFHYRPALLLVTSGRTPRAVHHRWSSSRSTNSSDDVEEEQRQARTWLAGLHAEALPLRTIGELSYSRSSGPGGQNVNKVNSKATLRVPLETLLNHVPKALHVQADESRKQKDNALACYKRLYDAIVEAGRNAVPKETSAGQQRHVKNLQKADNERRLKIKKQQSAKKGSRRGRGED